MEHKPSQTAKHFITVIVLLILGNFFLWQDVLLSSNAAPAYYFLDVSQGDSELLVFPDGVKLLIDGGPDSKILEQLGKILPSTDRYIDMVLMTHPQLDHFAGFIDVVKNYGVGVFFTPDRDRPMAAYEYLLQELSDKKVKHITLGAGDRIIYQPSSLRGLAKQSLVTIDVLSPAKQYLKSKELNDVGLMLMVEEAGVKSLFTADIGGKLELDLVRKYNLDADILKVGHHGSRFSSSAAFLSEVSPKISIIEVGAKNRYGHPTKQTLDRLSAVGSKIFRTDQDGNIKITFTSGGIKVYNLR